jgi:hypothetical protein
MHFLAYRAYLTSRRKTHNHEWQVSLHRDLEEGGPDLYDIVHVDGVRLRL